MKRMSPLAILLAGISVAAVMLGAGWQWNRIFAPGSAPRADVVAAASRGPEVPGEGADPVPEDSATPPTGNGGEAPPVAREPVARQALTGTWAGHLKEGSLAVAAKNGAAIAYLCDGDKLEAWLTGTAVDGRLELKGDDGSTLTGTADKKQATGTVTVGGKARDFTIEVAKKPSGLYRFASRVRGAKIVGGWIVLKDGRQVGLAKVNGQVVKPSTIDVTTGRATVGAETVTAVPAEDTTS
ncbi:hypothetical protein [Actinoplanes sp. NPDC049265]|uniref:hypothetical protein n=1 Tax=Actinoplanes sp. NPDC049265 TaxID=3363902 RepID=UPI00371ECCCE